MESGRDVMSRIASQIDPKLVDDNDAVRDYEARIIAEEVTGDSYSELLVSSYSLTDRQESQIASIVTERNTGMPLAYVVNSMTFRDLDLFVDERVLIPRQETELVVEYALTFLKDASSSTVVDVGTGSGAIALSIAHENKGAQIYATDISSEALEVAKLNGAAVGSPASRVQFLQGDLFKPLPTELQGKVDLIISNPPYVGEDERPGLSPSVLDYEPASALFADDDGFAIYQRLIEQAPKWLTKMGVMILEIAPRHVNKTRTCAIKNGFERIEIHADFTGRERIAVLRLPSS